MGRGLYANIHAKRKRGEKMRKKGAKGAPTAAHNLEEQSRQLEKDNGKKVKKVIKQLAKASKLHKAQSNVLKKHLKSMTNGRPKKRNR